MYVSERGLGLGLRSKKLSRVRCETVGVSCHPSVPCVANRSCNPAQFQADSRCSLVGAVDAACAGPRPVPRRRPAVTSMAASPSPRAGHRSGWRRACARGHVARTGGSARSPLKSRDDSRSARLATFSGELGVAYPADEPHLVARASSERLLVWPPVSWLSGPRSLGGAPRWRAGHRPQQRRSPPLHHRRVGAGHCHDPARNAAARGLGWKQPRVDPERVTGTREPGYP